MGPTIDNGADAMLLEELGAHAASTRPSVYVAKNSVFDWSRDNSPDIGNFAAGPTARILGSFT
jgi:hypothetical protein